MIEWLSFDVIAHLWQSTLVVGIVWLATLALRRHGARVRCWLWTAASVKFLVPFSWLMSFGAQFEWRTAPAIAQPAATFVMEEILSPPAVTVTSTVTAQHAAFWPWMLASLWAIGFVGVVFWWWRQWCLVRGALRQAKPVELGPGYDIEGLTVLSSPWTFEPGVVGIWRPVLLLPDGLADRLSSAQLSALIAHERSHIRSHDNCAAAVHMLVEALFWFHPVVWWIEGRLIDERERACDEDVLRSGSRPSDYAEGILAVCRLSVRAPLACVAGVSGSNVKNRIRDIMTNRTIAHLSVVQKVILAGVGAVAVVAPIFAQSVSAPLAAMQRFEVASIKRKNVDAKMLVLVPRFLPGGSFEAFGVTLGSVIRLAYGLQDFQIVGGPKWVDSDRFDIQARGPQGAAESEAPRRLQSLLAERFALKAHMETRDHPIYALVLARADKSLGPRLRRSQFDPQKVQEQELKALREKNPETYSPPQCGLTAGRRLGSCGSTMSLLASRLPMYVGRMVVDRTGLTGGYDYELSFGDRPILGAGPGGGFPAPFTAQAADPNGPSLFTALEDQLGLKLVPQTGRVEVLVIDHVEPPKPN